jgi:hypothetical protein
LVAEKEAAVAGRPRENEKNMKNIRTYYNHSFLLFTSIY